MSNTIQNGKGSKRRPGKEIPQEDWDNIFKKKSSEIQQDKESCENKKSKN